MSRRVTFAAVGSSSNVPALEVDGGTDEEVADEVMTYVRPLLCAMTDPPRPIAIHVDLVVGYGLIRCAGQPAGWFLVREVHRD